MDYYERIKRAVDFIEENLTQRFTLDEVARQACYSKYHFIRIFYVNIGETVGDYIRKRRLTRASSALIATERPILDIALEYGFESQEAFSRSFRNLYGTTPGAYRRKRINQIAFARAQLTLNRLTHLKKGVAMKPIEKELDQTLLVGMSTLTSFKDNKIYELWERFMPRAGEIGNRKGESWYEVMPMDAEFDKSEFTTESPFKKIACVEVTEFPTIPEGMMTHTIKSGRYMMFTHRGPVEKIQLTYDYIYGTWLPNSGMEIDERDSFELYDERFKGPFHTESEFDIYLAVR